MQALDNLLAAERARRSASLARLEAITQGLDEVFGDPLFPEQESEPAAGGSERAVPRRGSGSPDAPFVSLPQRTTHGGPFGPAVREKLIAEAMEKRRW